MDRVLDEIPDPFWAPGAMNRSSSEWLLEKFLEEEASIPNPNPNPNPNPVPNTDDEVVEVKAPPHPTAAVDPGEYAAMLKQKLDMYCRAVAITRGSAIKPSDSSLADTRSPVSDSSQLGSQAPYNGNGFKVPNKTGGGQNGIPAQSPVQNSVAQARPVTSGSSSDDDDLEGDAEMMENMDPSDAKRVRRMLSNRESARRSRRRKQAHLSELETQVSQLRVENSTLLKRLTDINQKYSEAAVDNRVLKADVETLRAKVKMAEDGVKRVTGASPMFPTMSDISSISMPFSASPSDATSDTAVPIQDDPNLFFQASSYDRQMNTGLPEIPSASQAVDVAVGKMGRTASMQRVASLEHLQKRICGTPSSCGSGQWDVAGWDSEISGNKKHNQV